MWNTNTYSLDCVQPDLENAPVAHTNFTIDQNLYPSRGNYNSCFVTPENDKWLDHTPITINDKDYPSYIKPIAGYLSYIGFKTIPCGTTITEKFEKKKGYKIGYSVSLEIQASIGANFKYCETSLSITTGFEYEEEISVEEVVIFEQTVTGPVTYLIYQPVILYVNRVENHSIIRDQLQAYETQYVEYNNEFFFLKGLLRNEPFMIEEENEVPVVCEFDLCNKLLNDYWNNWYTELNPQACGRLFDLDFYNDGTYIVSSEKGRCDLGIQYNETAFNFLLTEGGRLYHLKDNIEVKLFNNYRCLSTIDTNDPSYNRIHLLYTDEKKLYCRELQKYVELIQRSPGTRFDLKFGDNGDRFDFHP